MACIYTNTHMLNEHFTHCALPNEIYNNVIILFIAAKRSD